MILKYNTATMQYYNQNKQAQISGARVSDVRGQSKKFVRIFTLTPSIQCSHPINPRPDDAVCGQGQKPITSRLVINTGSLRPRQKLHTG